MDPDVTGGLYEKGPSSKRQAERAPLRVDTEIPDAVTAAGAVFMND